MQKLDNNKGKSTPSKINQINNNLSIDIQSSKIQRIASYNTPKNKALNSFNHLKCLDIKNYQQLYEDIEKKKGDDRV